MAERLHVHDEELIPFVPGISLDRNLQYVRLVVFGRWDAKPGANVEGLLDGDVAGVALSRGGCVPHAEVQSPLNGIDIAVDPRHGEAVVGRDDGDGHVEIDTLLTGRRHGFSREQQANLN